MRLLTKINYVRCFVTLTVLAILTCMFSFSSHVAKIRQHFQQQVIVSIQRVLDQQQILLQRLGHNLLLPIQNKDQLVISAYLSAYEDQLYVAAQQGLAIPASLSLVSLSAPLNIISSIGLAEASTLAPDEEYYLRVVRQPKDLSISQQYIRLEMPDCKLINFGLGVLDHQQQFIAHLDAKIAVAALQKFVQNSLPGSSLYSFDLSGPDMLQPKIVLHKKVYWLEYFKYTSNILLKLWVVFSLIWFGLLWYFKSRDKDKTINSLQKENDIISTRLNYLLHANVLQDKYAAMSKSNQQLQNIELHDFLTEARTLNAELIHQHNINLILPQAGKQKNLFFAHRLHMIQLVAGILQEIILQVGSGNTIELQIELIEDTSQQQLIFKFSDNGYYSSLTDREIRITTADIRCQGWNNIYALAALENATIQHKHTAYVGNTITLSIPYRVKNNVVNLNWLVPENS